MALVRSSSRFGKKPASTAAAHKSTAKKSQAASKGKPGKQAGSKNSKAKKSNKSSAKFASLKAKQMTIDKMKRTAWASMQKITESIIGAASSGNLAAAKEMYNLAGVYDVPLPDDENAAAAVMPVPAPPAEVAAAKPASVHPIDAFFDKIGVPPSTADPEAESA